VLGVGSGACPVDLLLVVDPAPVGAVFSCAALERVVTCICRSSAAGFVTPIAASVISLCSGFLLRGSATLICLVDTPM
jgi:hypothetical protein